MVWTKVINEVLQSSQQQRIFCASRLNFYFAGEDVIFIANDWHTALLPCYLKTMYQSVGIFKNARVGLNHTGLLFYSAIMYLVILPLLRKNLNPTLTKDSVNIIYEYRQSFYMIELDLNHFT